MNFDTSFEKFSAHSGYSQISIQYDTTKHSIAQIIDKTESLGGIIQSIDIIKSDISNHKIALIKLNNYDVCKIVIGLNEDNLLEAIGISRCE